MHIFPSPKNPHVPAADRDMAHGGTSLSVLSCPVLGTRHCPDGTMTASPALWACQVPCRAGAWVPVTWKGFTAPRHTRDGAGSNVTTHCPSACTGALCCGNPLVPRDPPPAKAPGRGVRPQGPLGASHDGSWHQMYQTDPWRTEENSERSDGNPKAR